MLSLLFLRSTPAAQLLWAQHGSPEPAPEPAAPPGHTHGPDRLVHASAHAQWISGHPSDEPSGADAVQLGQCHADRYTVSTTVQFTGFGHHLANPNADKPRDAAAGGLAEHSAGLREHGEDRGPAG